MISIEIIEMWKGIQERDEVIKVLVAACTFANNISDCWLMNKNIDTDHEHYSEAVALNEMKVKLQQALAKANPGSGEEKPC